MLRPVIIYEFPPVRRIEETRSQKKRHFTPIIYIYTLTYVVSWVVSQVVYPPLVSYNQGVEGVVVKGRRGSRRTRLVFYSVPLIIRESGVGPGSTDHTSPSLLGEGVREGGLELPDVP